MSAEIEVVVRVTLEGSTMTASKSASVHPRLVATSLPVMAEQAARLLAAQYSPKEPQEQVAEFWIRKEEDPTHWGSPSLWARWRSRKK